MLFQNVRGVKGEEESSAIIATMSASNMYRTGDYVYVDAGPVSPFGVRRIDELQKSASGNVEMEVVNWKPFCS